MLLDNHILRSLLEARPPLNIDLHNLSLNSLTSCQRVKIRGIFINMDNRFNKVFPAFDPFNKEFALSSKIINSFANYFSFHPF